MSPLCSLKTDLVCPTTVFHAIWLLLPKSICDCALYLWPPFLCHLDTFRWPEGGALFILYRFPDRTVQGHTYAASRFWWGIDRCKRTCIRGTSHTRTQYELVYVWALGTPLVWPHDIRPFVAHMVFVRLFLLMRILQVFSHDRWSFPSQSIPSSVPCYWRNLAARCYCICSASALPTSCSSAWYHYRHVTRYWILVSSWACGHMRLAWSFL